MMCLRMRVLALTMTILTIQHKEISTSLNKEGVIARCLPIHKVYYKVLRSYKRA